MTPKEKAEKLVQKMFYELQVKIDQNRINEAKKCALVLVNEIKNAIDWFGYTNTMYDHPVLGKCRYTEEDDPNDYWEEVKQEIQNL